MITALPLLVSALLGAAPPYVDLALARRTGVDTAQLTLREADPRLTALCFDPIGYEPEQVALARQAIVGRRVWLYLGPRRVAQGRVEAVDTVHDPFGPCAVEALARFDGPVPLVARSDVLWASTERFDSSPREPAARDAVERARRALEPQLAEACLTRTAASARGTRSGTYVGLTCPLAEGEFSVVVAVPAKAEPKVVLIERSGRGAVSLVDVLDPRERGQHRLVLAREQPEGRRLEIWESDGEAATPLACERLFLQRLDYELNPPVEPAEQ
jgi:hypothetical protein